MLKPKKQREGDRPEDTRDPLMRRGKRRTSSQEAIVQEVNWDGKFNVMGSKNNIQVHKHYREFFDKPINYDVKGYEYTKIPHELEVYEGITPILNGTRSGYLRPVQWGTTGLQDLQRDRSSGRESPLQDFHSIPNLRGAPQQLEKREKSWKHIGMPISTFNEAVHPRYRLGFDKLKK